MTDVDPERAAPRDPAEFVAAMRELKAAAHMGFRTLEKRAEAVGDVLPKSTLIAVLSRDTLPREEVVAAFVRACGLGEEAVERWLAVRRGIVRGGLPDDLALPVNPPPEPEPAAPPQPEPAAPPPPPALWEDLVPPAIRHGSWPLRVASALLLALVALVTISAVVASVRDWTASPEDGRSPGTESLASSPGSIPQSPSVPPSGNWTPVGMGQLSLADQEGVDFETMQQDSHVPGSDLELLQRGARVDAAAKIVLLKTIGKPTPMRCLEPAAQDWDSGLDGVDKLAPGSQACVVTDSGLLVMLTVQTPPTGVNPVLLCQYAIWRKLA